MKTFFLAIAVSVCAVSLSSAEDLELHDTLVLKSGSQLTGTIVEVKTEDNREYVVFRTASGSVYKLDTKLLVKRVYKVEPEYKKRLADMDENSAQAHFEMYEWLKEQSKTVGRSVFKREMDYHLRRIIELDPNDEKAMRLLDYDRFDGQLLHKDHKYSGHGYVRMAGKWVPELFLDVLANSQQYESIINERKTALKKWTRQIGKVSDVELEASLNEIADAHSVGLIYANALKEKRDNIRLVYVNSLGKIPSPVAANALVHFAVRDDNRRVRDQAFSLLISQPHFDKASTALKASVFLQDKDRLYLLRAANLVGELGQLSAFAPLVDALRTTHEIAPGQDPRRMNSAFNSGGTQPNTFSFGGNKKPVKRTFENEEVLSALKRITGQHYGFEPEPWKAWYVSEHTMDRYDISGDE